MQYPEVFNTLKTPVFVTDIEKLKANMQILDSVQERTGAKVLLALKAFAQYSTFSELSNAYNGKLQGCCASSPHEARLAKEEFKGEVHAFAAAYSQDDIDELLPLCDHILFNSFKQFETYTPCILEYNKQHGKNIEIGLRINPEHSEGEYEIYDPCSPSSRLGIRLADFKGDMLEHVSGLHFHTLCEQNSDALARTLEAVEYHFGEYMYKMKWINFGGGHHVTRSDYDINLLCECIEKVRDTYNVQVYIEPGEAVALNAGYLVTTVLDIIQADLPTAILDCSAACHTPDVIEMPYTPMVFKGSIYKDLYPVTETTYRLAGKSCLAGDNIGIYTFDEKLEIGSKVVFKDMAIYSMVKTNTFNGIALPSIARYEDEVVTIDKEFGYEDFKSRL